MDINSMNSAAAAGLPYRAAQGTSSLPPMGGAGRVAQAESSRVADEELIVQESVDTLNEFIRPYVTSLQFSVDRDLGKVVVKIMDTETKEVIKQIPSEEVLALTKALGKVEGLLVKQEA